MKDNEKGLKYSPIINKLLKHIDELRKITPNNRSAIYLREEDKVLSELDIDFDRLLDIFQTISPVVGIKAVIHEQDYQDGSFRNYWLIEIINEKKFINSLTEYSNHESKSESNKNKLIIYKDGKVIYFSESGKKYSVTLSINTSEYKLLYFLATNVEKKFMAKLIIKSGLLKVPKKSSDMPDDDRRVRSFVGIIRKKLGLNNKNPDDFFSVDNSFYGIKCNVELPP